MMRSLARTIRFSWMLLLLAPAGCGDQTVDEGDPGVTGREVMVSTEGASATVDLSTLAAADHDGVESVTLLAIVEASGLGSAATVSDLVGDDGFHASTGSYCKDGVFPVAHDLLDSGFVSVATGDVSWGTDPTMPSCMNVLGLAEIVLAP